MIAKVEFAVVIFVLIVSFGLFAIISSFFVEAIMKLSEKRRKFKALGSLFLLRVKRISFGGFYRFERVYRDAETVELSVTYFSKEIVEKYYDKIEKIFGFRVVSTRKEDDSYIITFQRVSEPKETNIEDEDEKVRSFIKKEMEKALGNERFLDTLRQIKAVIARQDSVKEVYVDKEPISVLDREGKRFIKLIEFEFSTEELFNYVAAYSPITGKREVLRLKYFMDATYMLEELGKELNVSEKFYVVYRDCGTKSLKIYLSVDEYTEKNTVAVENVEGIYAKIAELEKKNLPEEIQYEINQIKERHIPELVKRYQEEGEDFKELEKALEVIENYLEEIKENRNEGRFRAYKRFVEKKYAERG